MSKLQIMGAPQSNFVWVTRIVATEKGAPYDLVPAMPHTPMVDAAHPLGMLRRLGRSTEAVEAYRAAIALTENAAERAYLQRRMAALVQ